MQFKDRKRHTVVKSGKSCGDMKISININSAHNAYMTYTHTEQHLQTSIASVKLSDVVWNVFTTVQQNSCRKKSPVRTYIS